MKLQNFFRRKNHITAFILIGCILLSLLGMIKTLFISFDMDEAYAVTQSYRMVLGDQMILNMWEPHQFSAYLSTAFIGIYMFLFHTTEGVVVALRIFGTLIHCLLGFGFYRTIKKLTSTTFALFLMLVHLNFLPKWIQVPEFELMHYWGLLLIFICGIRYYCLACGYQYLLLAGLCMMLQVLNYPTMILLYPFYVTAILLLRKHPKKEIMIITLSAVIPGLIFLIYLFCHMSFSQFIQSLSHILADPSHTEKGFGVRISEYLTEFVSEGITAFLIFVFILLIVYGIQRFIYRKKYSLPETVLYAVALEFCMYTIYYVYGCLFKDQNQFYLQIRYLLLTVTALLAYKTYTQPKSVIGQTILGFGLIPGIISLPATLLLTNMTVNVAYSKLFICGYCAFIFLYFYCRENEKKSVMMYLPVIFLLGSLIFSKTILIRVTGCLPVTIRMQMEQITEGPLKDIYVPKDLYAHLQEGAEILTQYVTEEDSLLYFGCENILYLYTDAQISAASVQGTSVFNEDFIEYFSLFPEKYPSAVLVDHTFKYNYGSAYSPYNYIMEEWILHEFKDAYTIECEGFTLYKTQ